MSRVPRIDLDKYRQGGPKERRSTVGTGGDALRRWGLVRIQRHGIPPELLGPGGEGELQALLGSVAGDLLGLLEDYFGLGAGDLVDLVAARGPAAAGSPSEDVLLAVGWVTANNGGQVRQDAGWTSAAAREGELLAVVGPALASLTRGVLPADRGRLTSSMVVEVLARPGTAPRNEFGAGGPGYMK